MALMCVFLVAAAAARPDSGCPRLLPESELSAAWFPYGGAATWLCAEGLYAGAQYEVRLSSSAMTPAVFHVHVHHQEPLRGGVGGRRRLLNTDITRFTAQGGKAWVRVEAHFEGVPVLTPAHGVAANVALDSVHFGVPWTAWRVAPAAVVAVIAFFVVVWPLYHRAIGLAAAGGVPFGAAPLPARHTE